MIDWNYDVQNVKKKRWKLMAGVTFGRRMKTNLRFDCELGGGNSNMFYVSPKKLVVS